MSDFAKDINAPTNDCISRQAAIDAVCMEWCGVKHQDCKHPFNVEKDDYYWCDGCETVFRTLPELPSAQPEISRIEQELHGKTPEEQYEFLYWLLLKFGLTYTDSRLAVIEWLRGEQDG